MENIFSGSEIVELGVQIEKNGEEEKHIEIFRGMLEKAQNYAPLCN